MARSRVRLKKLILEELSLMPIITVCCAKTGIPRATFYRWLEDEEFRRSVDEKIDKGRQAVNDLAKSRLIQKIDGGDLRAILAWLHHNDERYMKVNNNSNNYEELTWVDIIKKANKE